jgi:hypothetical protein
MAADTFERGEHPGYSRAFSRLGLTFVAREVS